MHQGRTVILPGNTAFDSTSSSGDHDDDVNRQLREDLRTDSKADYQMGYTVHNSADNRFYPTPVERTPTVHVVHSEAASSSSGPVRERYTTAQYFERDAQLYTPSTGVHITDLPLAEEAFREQMIAITQCIGTPTHQCTRCPNRLLATCRDTYQWFWHTCYDDNETIMYGRSAPRSQCERCQRHVLERYIDICPGCYRSICEQKCMLRTRPPPQNAMLRLRSRRQL